jgi:hypothetical protein
MDFDTARSIAKGCANTATPLPQYQSHKKVWALKIEEVVKAPYDEAARESPDIVDAFIVPEEKRFAPIPVNKEFMSKHAPKAGGYLVFYADGYRSFSPAKAFEEGYTRL